MSQLNMFTVAWIAALPTELAAAQGMLDEKYPDIQRPSFDDNSYTFGRIGPHKVVLVCLPAGMMGNNPAATVAIGLRASFPSLKFGVLVGIGGGVPSSKSDVRLGDVVICKPSGRFGGVVQYDYGKTVQSGIFKMTGSLNSPPQVLLGALAQLQAKYRREDSSVPAYLEQMLERFPKMRSSYSHRGAENDELFKSDYEHDDQHPTCVLCDRTRLVSREARNDTLPQVHYGLVASGNQVMRHGLTRDKISRQLDEEVLCFEMEAAGLMNTFPCLVIRGICDYADSHKHKIWQDYAAATAAAYAKELLLEVTGDELQRTSSFDEATSSNATIVRWRDPYSSLSTQTTLDSSKGRLQDPTAHKDLDIEIESDDEDDETAQTRGMFELWPNTPPDEPTKIVTNIDLIAIHGLGGGAFSSWTKSERLWLRDFLPNDCPEVRILTFGYDASAAFLGKEPKLSDIAMELLANVKAYRRRVTTENPRKLMFICHGLGGLVVKKALSIANSPPDNYSWFVRNTAGMILMGSPHHGPDTGFWSGLIERCCKVANIAGIDLLPTADYENQAQIFGNTCSALSKIGEHFTIFTFFEGVGTSKLKDFVVSKDSALTHLQNETAIPLQATHKNMCRYLTTSNPIYPLILDAVLSIVDSTKPGTEISDLSNYEYQLLQQLKRTDHQAVLDSIPNRWQSKSCQWLLENQEFKSWRDSSRAQSFSSQFLWIFGPPGSGKTVVTKYVLNYLRSAVPEIDPNITNHFAYFFCDDKIPLRAKVSEVLASILFQLLDSHSTAHLIRFIDQDLLELSKRRAEIMEKPEINKMILKSILNMVQRTRGHHFWLVVDALDELNADAREEVVNGLQRLLEGDWSGRLKVLVTSRSQFPSSLLPQIREQPLYIGLFNVDTQADVDRLLDAEASKLYSDLSASFAVSDSLRQDMQETLKRLAGGNFLQARLALANFEQSSKSWTKSKFVSLLERVQNTPSNLEDFYCGLLRQIPSHFQQTAKLAFSCVLAAFELLTLEQLHLIISIQDSHSSYADAKAVMAPELPLILVEYCGFMITANDAGIVQLRHQTAKELLLGQVTPSSQNQEILERFKISMAEAHGTLAKICIQLLTWGQRAGILHKSMNTLQKETLHKEALNDPSGTTLNILVKKLGGPPLLVYAARYWNKHYTASPNDTESNSKIVSYVMKPNFNAHRIAVSGFEPEVYKFLKDANPSIPSESPALHYILQQGDFPQIIRVLLSRGCDVNEVDEMGMSPLHWAVTHDRQKSYHVLLNASKVNINRVARHGHRIVHQCIEWKRIELLETLLQDERLDINSQNNQQRNPLAMAMELSREHSTVEIVELILGHGQSLDFSCRDEVGSTLLEVAFKTRQPEHIVKEILKRHDSTLNIGVSVLRSAGQTGFLDVERIIIQSDLDQVFRIDEEGMNTLTWYAFLGRRSNLERVLEILEPDVFTKRQEVGRYNLLHLCAHQGWEDLALTLQSKFHLKSLDSDHHGRTLLHWALEHHWDISKLDFSTKSAEWINRQDRDGLTALHLAVVNRSEPGIKALLARNANILLKDRQGSNPVHLAANEGYSLALQAFLAVKVKEYGRDGRGAALLHLLVRWCPNKVLKKYIKDKRPFINVVDKEHRTPLHYAAMCGNEEAVAVLLDKNAKIDPIDMAHQTPLHYAIREGQLAIVRKLVESGADIWKLDGFKQSCLQLSIRNGNMALIEYTMNNIDSVRNRDAFGKTALHRACKQGDASLVAQLLSRGIDCNTMDHLSQTALHVAVSHSNYSAVKSLLDNAGSGKLRMSELDNLGTTPLDRALFDSNERLVNLLSSWDAQSTKHYKSKFKEWEPYMRFCQGHFLVGGPLVIRPRSREPSPIPRREWDLPPRENNRTRDRDSPRGSNTPRRHNSQRRRPHTPREQDVIRPGLVRANGNSSGDSDGSLVFHRGDVIIIINTAASSWTGELNGRQGTVPRHLTHYISSPDAAYPVIISLRGAENLIRKGFMTNPDVFAEISLSSSPVRLYSRVQLNTRSPIWAEEFAMSIRYDDSLTIHLFDQRRRKSGGQGSLGVCRLSPMVILMRSNPWWRKDKIVHTLRHHNDAKKDMGSLILGLTVSSHFAMNANTQTAS